MEKTVPIRGGLVLLRYLSCLTFRLFLTYQIIGYPSFVSNLESKVHTISVFLIIKR